MGEPFIGEVRMFGFNFAPKGWAFCNGAKIPISQNPSLYAVMGPTYGGDGNTYMLLPDLRGRVPMHVHTGTDYAYERGLRGGMENVTLSIAEMGSHRHPMYGSSDPANKQNAGTGSNRLPAVAEEKMYAGADDLTNMNPLSTTPIGGGQPHINIQPTAVVNFCIALQGAFPPRN